MSVQSIVSTVARRRMRHAGVAFVGAGALVLLSACTTSVLNLEVGQCLNGATGTEVSRVTVVDCGQPHTSEVYSEFELPAGDFPGVDAINAQAEEQCSGQAFTDYVGVGYQESEIYLTYLTPIEDNWGNDREVTCMLANQDNSNITGSLRGANR